jgi:starch synthase
MVLTIQRGIPNLTLISIFHYDKTGIGRKREIKYRLLERFKLPASRIDKPLFGMITRIVNQKGIDILLAAKEKLFERDISLIILGSGQWELEEGLKDLEEQYPDKVGLYLGYNQELAHLIEAGSDFFLMPSLYEPCGLNQMYSLRYGTVPVVRRTGGLADTVFDVDEVSSGNGFVFNDYTPEALTFAVMRALYAYGEPQRFRSIQQSGMELDFSWNSSAFLYSELYRKVISEKTGA